MKDIKTEMIGYRSYKHNLSGCEMKVYKKFKPERVKPRTSAIPLQCSGHFVSSLGNIPAHGEDCRWIWDFLRSSEIWSLIYSLEFFAIYGFITSSQCDQLPIGLIAQLIKHCTGIAEMHRECTSRDCLRFQGQYRDSRPQHEFVYW